MPIDAVAITCIIKAHPQPALIQLRSPIPCIPSLSTDSNPVSPHTTSRKESFHQVKNVSFSVRRLGVIGFSPQIFGKLTRARIRSKSGPFGYQRIPRGILVYHGRSFSEKYFGMRGAYPFFTPDIPSPV